MEHVIHSAAATPDADRRRAKYITVDPDVIIRMMSRRNKIIRIVKNHLPEDARCVGILSTPDHLDLHLVIHSMTFDPLPSGEVVPRLEDCVLKETSDAEVMDVADLTEDWPTELTEALVAELQSRIDSQHEDSMR